MPGCLPAASGWKLLCCNHFQAGLVSQYIPVSEGVCTYLTTENISFSKGQLNLCLNLRWAKGHCNYLLYYLCHIWVTMKAEQTLPFIRKPLNKTQYNHMFCIQQILYWTNGCCRKLSPLLGSDWEHLSLRRLSRGVGWTVWYGSYSHFILNNVQLGRGDIRVQRCLIKSCRVKKLQ